MALRRRFVRNYEDLSDDNGFQFKFFCDICGNGYLTKYKRAPASLAKSAMEVASRLFGGFFYAGERAADVVRSAKWREAHDRAFEEAVEEAKNYFTQCPGCRRWVCPSCWNEQAGLCVECAPRTAVVVKKAKARAIEEKASELLRQRDFTREIEEAEEVHVICPRCGKPTSIGRFCEACGAPLTKQRCPKCGAEVSLNARFCGNCGTRLR